MLKIGGTLLAGTYAATLAWTGHALSDAGAGRSVHLASDTVHLLAAGAWVGALPGLASSSQSRGRCGTSGEVCACSFGNAAVFHLGYAQCERVGGDRPD
jgi:putative copper export protein